jgi:plastocyanin
MRNDILRMRFPILGIVILLAVLIAGCTGSPYGSTTQATTQTTIAPTPAETLPATPAATTPATPVKTATPTPQVTATYLNQMNVSVTISNFAFSPRILTVSNGTTVTWTNQDPTPHQIINDPGGSGFNAGLGQIFESHPLGTGESYAFTFTSTGLFPYRCAIPPAMEGQVIVKE